MKCRLVQEGKYEHPGWELISITYVPQYRWFWIWRDFGGRYQGLEPRIEFKLECEAQAFLEKHVKLAREKTTIKTLSTIVKQYG